MAVGFSPERWQRVRKMWGAWWDGTTDAPMVSVRLCGKAPNRPAPKVPMQGITAFYGLQTPVEDIVDAWDYGVASMEYLGGAFPTVFPNFGPGVMAAFTGCRLECGENTVWFHPTKPVAIKDLQLTYDADNVWLKHIKALTSAAAKRWQGAVLVGWTDCGGSLDVASSFLPGEELLMDLIESPDEVKRIVWQIHELWHRYREEFSALTASTNPGFSNWSQLYSDRPWYMLQCDFAYMIGPDMFAEFVVPELQATCKRLGRAFYHLDGKGQLPHLDHLLAIPELNGIQWVQGSGGGAPKQYHDVYRRVLAAGKRLQITHCDCGVQLEMLDELFNALGTTKGIYAGAWIGIEQKDRAIKFLERWGVPIE